MIGTYKPTDNKPKDKADAQEEVGKMKKEFANMLIVELGKLPQIPAIVKILDKIKDC